MVTSSFFGLTEIQMIQLLQRVILCIVHGANNYPPTDQTLLNIQKSDNLTKLSPFPSRDQTAPSPPKTEQFHSLPRPNNLIPNRSICYSGTTSVFHSTASSPDFGFLPNPFSFLQWKYINIVILQLHRRTYS